MDSISARRAGAAFEGLLLDQCLSSLGKGTGSLGQYGVDALAQMIAQKDEHGFGELLSMRLMHDGD